MDRRNAKLIDAAGKVQAQACVVAYGDLFAGKVDLGETGHEFKTLFNEFEEVVNGQMFSLLDDVQARISSCINKALFEDGCQAPIRDLQVFPTTGEVSFRLVEPCIPR